LIRAGAAGLKIDKIAELGAPDILTPGFSRRRQTLFTGDVLINEFFHERQDESTFVDAAKEQAFPGEDIPDSASPWQGDTNVFFTPDYFLPVFFLASGFFAAGFLAAGFAFGAGSFFLGTANAFFGGLGPLLVIGSSQQTSSATTQSQSSSTTKASPHTSQQSKSPGFTFDMNIPSCVVDGSKLFLSIRETRMSAILV
jgi:hypothetical protein